ncbi:MAG: hypothetical protein ACKOAD_02385 [Gammaproteobacteria bacterium]
MSDAIFIGRKAELKRLQALYKKQTPSLVVVKGRRRIGKSRLILEFANKAIGEGRFWSFAGLAPFAKQLSLMLKIPAMTFGD